MWHAYLTSLCHASHPSFPQGVFLDNIKTLDEYSNDTRDRHNLMAGSTMSERVAKLRDTCNECAAAKVRCSKDKPACSRCISRSLQCEYGVSKRSGRPLPHGSTAKRNGTDDNQNSTKAAASEVATAGNKAGFQQDNSNLLHDERLMSLLNPSIDDNFHDLLSPSGTFSLDGEVANSAALSNYDPWAFPFERTGSSENLCNLNGTSDIGWSRQSSDGYNSDASSCCCLSTALDMLRRCSMNDTSISISPADPGTAVSLNREVITSLKRTLACSCARNENMLTISGLIILQLIAQCSRAIKESGGPELDINSGTNMAGYLGSLTEFLGVDLRGLGRPEYRETRAAAQVILDDLYQTQDIVQRFSQLVQVTATSDPTPALGSAVSHDMAGLFSEVHNVSNGSLPQSSTLLMQMQANDLRRRLSAVSLEVVKILLRT